MHRAFDAMSEGVRRVEEQEKAPIAEKRAKLDLQQIGAEVSGQTP